MDFPRVAGTAICVDSAARPLRYHEVSSGLCFISNFVVCLCSVLPPPVMWAQRQQVVFVTICVEDCKNPDIKIEADKVYFKGVGGTEKKSYEVTLNLYKEIDPEVINHYIFNN